jgi:colanic acid biosynthesis glycosyl transferase WcaI
MANLLVVDFAGHGFQFELSRALARRGHGVTHSWCSTNLTPHGDLRSRDGVTARPIRSGATFEKYRFVARLRAEWLYGCRTGRLIREVAPDAVLTSNVPLVSLLCIAVAARRRHARWVLWLQDLNTGLAALSLKPHQRLIPFLMRRLERALIRHADATVVIDEAFVADVEDAGGPPPTVVPNWAVIADLPVCPKDNSWARRHGLDPDRPTLLYAGTLGRKHPPAPLLALARGLPDAQVVVVSEGVGATWLAEQAQTRQIANLLLLPFQDHADLAEVLGAADVLVAVLDPEAGGFSVPSKVMSYLCAGRPILAAMPAENGAARVVGHDARAGLVVPPTDDSVVEAARRLVDDRALREEFGAAARRYAVREFDVDAKAGTFAALLGERPALRLVSDQDRLASGEH